MPSETDSEFRRRMARFEIAKARRLKKEGRLDHRKLAGPSRAGLQGHNRPSSKRIKS